jgi:hypothetical protein
VEQGEHIRDRRRKKQQVCSLHRARRDCTPRVADRSTVPPG